MENHPLEINQAILANYGLLSSSGILAYLDQLSESSRNFQKIIAAGKDILSQSGILKIVEQVAHAFNERLVPCSLTFVLESDVAANKPAILYFDNMSRVDAPFDIPSLEPYRFFFSLSPDVATFPVFSYMIGRPELTKPFEPARPAMVVPIMGFNQVYGFILIGEKVVGGSYNKVEIDFIVSVLQFASIGLQNNIHYLKAITDSKTKLYNNEYIRNRLDLELARVKRYGHQIAVIITDVDHFKKFNDSYGHLTGDKVLMRIAEVFLETIRKGDIAGRFGGEEFVLVLAQCNKEDACMVADRIRRKVERLALREGDTELKVTISLGVRHVNHDTMGEAVDIIAQADKALYKAKQTGRNRSYLYDPLKSQ